MKRRFLTEGIAVLFILLFVYAASSKLMDYNKFTIELGKSPLLTAFANEVAIGIPATEIIIALLLCLPKTRLTGLYASLTLMTMFTAYIVTILRFSDYIPCSCGGILQNMNWQQHLVFNCVFVVLAVAGVLVHPEPVTTGTQPGHKAMLAGKGEASLA